MDKIIIGTNNVGKYKEICDLLPKYINKFSPKEFKIETPEETGKTFEENSLIKASYFSKKTNLICLSDDSGLEIDILNGKPGIFSSRWGGDEKNFDSAIEKVFSEIKKKKPKENINAKFICCMTLYWPDGKNFTTRGEIKGKISLKKRGINGFGYDPIFIPYGYDKTFGEMNKNLKMSIDHRFNAYNKIKKFLI